MTHLQHIRDAGIQAYFNGLGEDDCPYIECTDSILDVGYWDTSAAKRQVWLSGLNKAAKLNVAGLVRRPRPNRWGM